MMLYMRSSSPLAKRARGVAALRRLSSQPTSMTHVDWADKCNQHILRSPHPDIQPGPYPPLYEFVTSTWKVHGGVIEDNHVAVIDSSSGLSRTIGDFYKLAGQWAATLQNDMQISGPDETVAIYAPNHVDYVPLVLGVSMTGAKLTPINPLYTPQELEVVLQKSGTKVLVAHQVVLETALAAVKNCPSVKHVLVLTNTPADSPSASAGIPAGTTDMHSIRLEQSTVLSSSQHVTTVDTHTHPVILPYSSGTTGLPKGVLLSHKNIVTNLIQTDAMEQLTPGEKTISPLPFFHIYGLTVVSLHLAWIGQTLLTNSGRFDLEQFCQTIQEHKPTRAYIVPPIVVGLAKHPLVSQYDLSSLRAIVSGAAPLSLEVEQAVQARLPSLACVKQGYGMTETSPLASLATDKDALHKPGSVGQVVHSTRAKVIDEHGNSLPPNQDGELLLQGPQVLQGYLDEPEKTAECLSPSRWLRTGDIAHYDEDGYIYITDRAKELIKVRGMPVAPAELEALLLTHPDIKDAAVIACPDEVSHELPRAYVVASENVTDTMVYDWVRERVAPFKRLEGGVEFVSEIPKSASGKILRRVLKEKLLEATKFR